VGNHGRLDLIRIGMLRWASMVTITLDVVLGCKQAHDGCPWFHPRRRIPVIFSNTAQTAAVSSDGFFLVAAA
jgi:hypothetical protein